MQSCVSDCIKPDPEWHDGYLIVLLSLCILSPFLDMHGYCRVHCSTELYFEQNRLSLEKKKGNCAVIYMVELLQVGYLHYQKAFLSNTKPYLLCTWFESFSAFKNTFCFYAACTGRASNRFQGLHRGKARTREDGHLEAVRNFQKLKCRALCTTPKPSTIYIELMALSTSVS